MIGKKQPRGPIYYENAFKCSRCPNSNAVPNGCPFWLEEIFENTQTREVETIKGCAPQVQFILWWYQNGRIALNTDTVQAMRQENAETVASFGAVFTMMQTACEQLAAADERLVLEHKGADNG